MLSPQWNWRDTQLFFLNSAYKKLINSMGWNEKKKGCCLKMDLSQEMEPEALI